MVIHTLGPAATDSFAAAEHYNQVKYAGQATVCGHPSFEEILTTLAGYHGDELVIPAAFKSSTLKAGWGDIHYALLEQLTLRDCFMTVLDPIVVVQRIGADNRIGYTHAATAQLLERVVSHVSVQTCASKYLAY
ncbi:amino acid biosynthesis protein [Lactiplantibacillus garii]|uniref:amino acid biosynthesis protein n=1 Tax=Lactiplantibacillus garii TaxID=2306423 RepID=UPI001CDD6E73|nr:amino acid biosynthesis protein [Lactiplantibacillus garii]